MKNIDQAGIRSARWMARVSLRRHRRSSLSALAAGLALCVAFAWGAPSGARAPASALATVASNADVSAIEQSCEGGDAVQCNDLGVTYLKGYGVPVDVDVAFRAFERASLDGSADGCGNLGAMYESGAGVQANLTDAARLYAFACRMDRALACSNLGVLYARGRGVPRDLDKARQLFTLACETDSAAGCNNLIELSSPRR